MTLEINRRINGGFLKTSTHTASDLTDLEWGLDISIFKGPSDDSNLKPQLRTNAFLCAYLHYNQLVNPIDSSISPIYIFFFISTATFLLQDINHRSFTTITV